jgi:hypothetical protein
MYVCMHAIQTVLVGAEVNLCTVRFFGGWKKNIFFKFFSSKFLVFRFRRFNESKRCIKQSWSECLCVTDPCWKIADDTGKCKTNNWPGRGADIIKADTRLDHDFVEEILKWTVQHRCKCRFLRNGCLSVSFICSSLYSNYNAVFINHINFLVVPLCMPKGFLFQPCCTYF